MNYYEELGIRPDADEEEIRKAHRRLVKLMHPDQHRDEGLKALAETQMRRLNSIVATLLDPEEREEYDEELRGGHEAAKQGPPPSTWRAVPWWIASTLGAIILTVGTLWFFADRMGPTRPNHPPTDIGGDTSEVAKPLPPPHADQHADQGDSANSTVANVPVPTVKENPPQPVVKETPKQPEPDRTIAVTQPAPPPAPPTIRENQTVKAQPVNTVREAMKPPAAKLPDVAAVKTLPKTTTPRPPAPVKLTPPSVMVAEKPKPFTNVPPIQSVTAPQKDNNLVAGYTPPAAPVTAGGDIPRPDYRTPPPPPTPVIRRSNDPLEGDWVYAPTTPEKHKPGFYPPEFIQLKLVKDTTGIRGEYSARYDVDKEVAPDVNFVLIATDATGTKYQWRAANGARGWLNIKDLESDTMRLEWKETSKQKGAHLTSGQATLVRKN